MVVWPEWWHWELELSPHLFKRMADRSFNDTDLRLMLEQATGYHIDEEPGRWVIETLRDGDDWEVIVEPDLSVSQLVVVTAYPVG